MSRDQRNRRDELLAAAARQFSERGFEAASMRDIAAAAGMLGGSIYYHFPSKDALIAAVHAESIRWIGALLNEAIDPAMPPWERLEAMCVAHLEALLSGSDFAGVTMQETARLAPDLQREIADQRDTYERRFTDLIDELALADGIDPGIFRLTLMGALNWATRWYRPGRRRTPTEIARQVVRMLRAGAADHAARPASDVVHLDHARDRLDR
jgi:AcrR family transcriptional regulator